MNCIDIAIECMNEGIVLVHLMFGNSAPLGLLMTNNSQTHKGKRNHERIIMLCQITIHRHTHADCCLLTY